MSVTPNITKDPPATKSSRNGVSDSSQHEQLRVLGLGFQRCGSYSLKYALEELGYNTFHPIQMLEYTVVSKKWPDCHQWRWWVDYDKHLSNANNDYKKINFDEYFDTLKPGTPKYDALLDWPFCFYWKELTYYYPNCKCILLTRSKERWYKSFMTLYSTFLKPQILRTIYKFFEPKAGWFGQFGKICLSQVGIGDGKKGKILDNPFDELRLDTHKEILLNGYDKRKKEIEEYFENEGKNRLLVYSLIEDFDNDYDKWKILCDFLNKDIPRDKITGQVKKFPHRNQKEFLTKAFKTVQWWILQPTIVVICFIILAVLVKYLW